MPVIEFEGKTTEEAIDKACNQLHIPPDELRFEIVSTGSSGIFGIGGKKASIRVTIQERISARTDSEPEPAPYEEPVQERPRMPRPRREDSHDRPERRRRDRPDRRGDGEQREHSERSRPERRQPDESLERPQRRDRTERSGHSGRGPRQENRTSAENGERTERSEPRRGRDRQRSEQRTDQRSRPRRSENRSETPINFTPPTDMPLPATMAAPGETVHEGPEDSEMITARQVLEEILRRMGLPDNVTVRRIEDRIILSIQGEDSGLLIGKKGATLDALQFLVNKIVNKDKTEKNRIILDTEEYRSRRHQSLIELAMRMAEKAIRTRRPVTISQLSAHDRRVVHLALQERQDMKTRSRGDGPLKNVLIIPTHGTSAPSPEEAVEAPQEAPWKEDEEEAGYISD